jgi:quinol monooxygenase YgiN
MRPFVRLVLGIAILTATLAEPARAQDSAVYIATYIEVTPNAVDSAAALLERYRDASRKERGNLRLDVLHEIGRPARFAILEVWKDKAALESYEKAESTLHFREKLKAIQTAPPDERVDNAIDGGALERKSRTGVVFVLTHVDVLPQYKDDCLSLLRTMSIDTPRDYGNADYEVLQQENRANHFTVVEEWASRRALDTHTIAAHTRAFRERLSPMVGALYDERIYNELN